MTEGDFWPTGSYFSHGAARHAGKPRVGDGAYALMPNPLCTGSTRFILDLSICWNISGT